MVSKSRSKEITNLGRHVMKQRPTRSDVAARAGVSKTTVTYVLGDNYNIAIPEPTRERVRKAAAELGYRPSAVARALVSGRTNSIAIAFPGGIGTHDTRVLRAFDRHANAHGCHMMASTIGHISFDNVLPDLWSVISGPNDGVILVDMNEAFRPLVEQVLPAAKPIVSMGAFPAPQLDCVQVDLEAGARAAIAHLLESNPARVAIQGFWRSHDAEQLASGEVTRPVDPRFLAYVRCMHDAGRPLEFIGLDYRNRREGIERFKEYIAANGCPDAIFCYNDEEGIIAHRALRELGKRLPEDVLLIGCDGIEECESVEPQLSTIVQPIDLMCERAWDLLQARLADPGRPLTHELLPAELVIRRSSVR